jgi:hypothetical protein
MLLERATLAIQFGHVPGAIFSVDQNFLFRNLPKYLSELPSRVDRKQRDRPAIRYRPV